MYPRIVLLLFIGLCAQITSAQTKTPPDFNKAKMDSLFDALDQNNKSMGTLVLSEKGKTIYSRSTGYAVYSESEKIRANEQTIYRIGSVSKMFTAVMIFQFIEEKKLSLETTLDKYFPKVPNAKKITIGQLLNHHSGIHDFTRDSTYKHWMEKPQSHEEMLKRIESGTPDFEPGARGEYSNSNFVLLGYIIEKVGKKPYADALRERITKKLGLEHTYYGGKINPAKHESYSYTWVREWEQEPETDMSIPNGAGSVVSRPGDLVKFIEALFDKKLVSEKSLNTMMTMTDHYGMGIFIFPFDDKALYGHNGKIDGFASMLVYFPKEKMALAYCTNGEVIPVNQVLIGILSIYFNDPYKIPSFKTVSLTAEELEPYLGVYSSTEIPLKITITREQTTLMVQATGQPQFTLEAREKNTFVLHAAGAVLIFDTAKKELTLQQGGGSLVFTKD